MASFDGAPSAFNHRLQVRYAVVEHGNRSGIWAIELENISSTSIARRETDVRTRCLATAVRICHESQMRYLLHLQMYLHVLRREF